MRKKGDARFGSLNERRGEKRERQSERKAVRFRQTGRMRRDGPALLLDHHLGAPDPAQNVDGHIGSVALQDEVDTGFANAE